MSSVHASRSSIAGARARRKVRRSPRSLADRIAPYLFIGPFLFSFVVLFAGPAIYSLVLSFYSYRGYGHARFVGLANYISTLQYHTFWTMLQNTVFYWLCHAVPLIGLAFFLAVFVRSKFVPAKAFFKAAFFLPGTIAVVAASLVFQSFFGTKYGALDSLLGVGIPWLQEAGLSKVVIVILLIWRNVGFWFVVFLAGLTSINPELDDAARIDGATAWQRMRFITIPLMRPMFLFAFVIDAINSFQLFTEPNVLLARGGALADESVAPLLNLLVMDLRSGGFGRASAVAWILFLLIAVVSFVQSRILSTNTEAATR